MVGCPSVNDLMTAGIDRANEVLSNELLDCATSEAAVQGCRSPRGFCLKSYNLLFRLAAGLSSLSMLYHISLALDSSSITAVKRPF